MQSLGPGVWELKESNETTWYRMMYLSRIDNVIHILHCFEKKTRKTDRLDLEIVRDRLGQVKQRIRYKTKKWRMRRRTNRPGHVTKRDVIDYIGFAREYAAAIRVM